MYISWDPPLVLHIADLLMDSIAGHWQGSYLAQGYYCVAAVSLEPAIIRPRVPLSQGVYKHLDENGLTQQHSL